MVEYEKKGPEIDSLVCLKVIVDKEGELTIDELESIDEQMLSTGSERTGQRVGVTSTKMQNRATVKYIYQETIIGRSIENIKKRLEAYTDFDNPSIMIDAETVEYK